MYARVTTVDGLSEAGIKEAVRFFQQESLPVLEEEPGFRGAVILVGVMEDRDSAIGLTLWDTRKDVRMSREKEYDVRKEVVETSRAGLEGKPPRIRTYEVLVNRLGEAATTS